MGNGNNTLVHARDLTKVYRTGDVEVHALRGVTLEVHAGEFLAIVGPSGSGKTTLLNLAGALDSVTGGALTVLGRDLAKLGRRARADLRLRSLGFVFQAYNLVPVLTARENVEFVLELQGVGHERRARSAEVLEELGLDELADRRPLAMSGGQQQRVAVARAVASRPIRTRVRPTSGDRSRSMSSWPSRTSPAPWRMSRASCGQDS